MSSGEEMRCVRAVVSGRVQGVGFRYATFSEAQRLGVAGTVRNLPDGRVEAVFEGPADVVEAALAFVHVGPSMASVSGVDVDEEALQGFSDFQIRE